MIVRLKHNQDFIRIRIGDTNIVSLRIADKIRLLEQRLGIEPDTIIEFAIDKLLAESEIEK